MKKMLKLISVTSAVAALFFAINAKAQTTPMNAWRLGIGVEGGIPTGSITNFSNFELGGTVRLQYGISNDLALTLTSGFYDFFAKSSSATLNGITYTAKPQNLGLIPGKVGIKAFVGEGFYVAGEVGGALETDYNKFKKIILSPGIGYATKSWDVGLRYEDFLRHDNYGTVALRLAYGFGL